MIKRVLVYTFGSQSHEAAIKTAAAFATKHNATLTGLFIRPEFGGYLPIYGAYPLDLVDTYFKTQDDFEEKAKAQFDDIVPHYDIASQWHGIREYEKEPTPALYADYIFVSQPNKEHSAIFNDAELVDHLIIASGLPTVVVPQDWSSDSFALRPVLGWKATREAAGAVRQTLDLMRNSEGVDIVSVAKRTNLDKELVEGISISEYLSEHGVVCNFSTERMLEDDHDEAHTLLRHVGSRNRDLIIIGGYGHSRLREIILGGMTRALIKKSTVPLLLSH